MSGSGGRGATGTFRVQITLADEAEVERRYGEELRAATLFVHEERPPPIGCLVVVEFIQPLGTLIAQVIGTVTTAKPATVAGDRTAGMGLALVDYDSVAARLRGGRSREMTPAPGRSEERPQSQPRTIETIAPGPQQARPQTRRETRPQTRPQMRPQTRPETRPETRPHTVEKITTRTRVQNVSGPIVGIDLGTTNSCVAIVSNGIPEILPTPEGYDTLPSVVYIDPKREVFVGRVAQEKMGLDPSRAIYGSKRFIGRPFHSNEVKRFGHFFHYGLASGKNGRTAARIGDMVIPLEVVSAYILRQLRRIAESRLGQEVRRAVITVPAHFGEAQRQSIRDAAMLAGLVTERIVTEPTAAAVAYGYGRSLQARVLVYDLGGGTFDASLLAIDHDQMEVLRSEGDPFLGGSDFDDRLTEHILSSVQKRHGIVLRNEPLAVQRIRSAAEAAKKQLSDAVTAEVNLRYLSMTPQGPFDLQMVLERSFFEQLTDDLVDRSLLIVQEVLDRTGISAKDLDNVIMVGGQSRIPRIRQRLGERFGKAPARNVHPDLAVAMGAALIAAALQQSIPVRLTDVLSGSIRLGVRGGDTRVLIGRGERLPCEKRFRVGDIPSAADTVLRLALYRGEQARAAENEALGVVQLPSSRSLGVTSTNWQITVAVSTDGLLAVTATHPETQAQERLEVGLETAAADVPADRDVLQYSE